MITLAAMTAIAALSAGPEAYLFAHMFKEDYGRLYYSVSRNGLDWTVLNNRKRITDDYAGHPDICQGHDGRYYLIGNRTKEPEITIWVSDNLITWTRHSQFTPEFDNIPNFSRGEHHNGAPKIYYDEPLKTYLITWHTPMERASKDEPELMWSSMRTLYVTSKDLKEFTHPKRLLDFEMATIDTIVRRVGNKCYAIIKDERTPSDDWPTGKTIRVCVADNLFGPYAPPGPSITKSFREAPTVIPGPDGRWRLYCEQYPGIRYECFTAPCLDGPWKLVPRPKDSVPVRARHGAMIPISLEQYNALCAAYPNTPGSDETSAERAGQSMTADSPGPSPTTKEMNSVPSPPRSTEEGQGDATELPQEQRGMSERLEKYLALEKVPFSPKDMEGMLTKEDLPILHEIVKDPSYAEKWRLALFAICQLDDPQRAFDTVIQHIQRPHDFGRIDYLSYFHKVGSVVYLGRLDRRVTAEFLKRAITKEGAKEVLAPWRHVTTLTVDVEGLEMTFRSKAADAMLRYEDEGLLDSVRQEYHFLRQIPPRDRGYLDDELCRRFRKTLAIRDMQRDYGVDEARRILISEDRQFDDDLPILPRKNTLTRYLAPYYREEEAMWPPEDAEPQ